MTLVQLLQNHVERTVCDILLRENSMHKAMQEDTVATQTIIYILAQSRTW
jgi:hypothetical protein